MMSKYISLLLVILSISSCEEQVSKPLNSRETNLLAVEGVLTNEKINHRIRLTHPYQTLNGIPAPATGAIVQISDGTTIYLLTESPTGSGEYYTPELRASFGLVYTLVIQYKNQHYTASDSSIPVEPLPALDYRSADDEFELNLYDVGQKPNYVDHYISWRNTDQCAGTGSCEGRLVYYDLKTVDVNEIFKPDQEVFLFPHGSTIVRKKYSTSAAYQSYLRSMLSETQWRGGVFDVDRANATTNLDNGAIGFFAVSTVVADTTIVQKP